MSGARPPIGAGVWGDTAPRLPEAWLAPRFRDVFTGRLMAPASLGGAAGLPLAEVFRHLPVALLERLD